MKAIYTSALTVLIAVMVMPATQAIATSAEKKEEPSSRARMDVPPPPPGPYMSMALRDAPVFGNKRNMPSGDALHSPFFKSDMPWPEARRMPKRWMPDDKGYTYAPPKQPPAVMQPNQQRHQRVQPAWGALPPPGSRPSWDRPAPPMRSADTAPVQQHRARPPAQRRNQAPQRPWLPLDAQRGW